MPFRVAMKQKKHHPCLSKSLFALDLGSSKLAIGGLLPATADESPRLDTVAIPSRGFKRGLLVSMPDALEAMRDLVNMAETHFNTSIDRVSVGVSGSHLQSRAITASVPIEGGAITRDTLHSLESRATESASTDGREVLHVIATGYHIDGQRPVDNPCGLSGNTLHGEFLVIDGDLAILRDVIKLCNEAGLEVARLAATPLVSALVNSSTEARQLGCAVLDMGAGITDGIVFIAGKPRFLFNVAIGGQLMAQDLGIGLNVSFTEAERLKNHCGLTTDGHLPPIEVRDLRGTSRMIGHHDVYPVLAPRVHELLTHLAKRLGHFQGALGAGLMLTGGGSEMPALLPFIERASGMMAHQPTLELPLMREIETALDGDLTSHVIDDPHLSGVLGILHDDLERRADAIARRQVWWPNRYWNQLANWLKELS